MDINEKLRLIYEGHDYSEVKMMESESADDVDFQLELFESTFELVMDSADNEFLTESTINVLDKLVMKLYKMKEKVDKNATENIERYKIIEEKIKNSKNREFTYYSHIYLKKVLEGLDYLIDFYKNELILPDKVFEKLIKSNVTPEKFEEQYKVLKNISKDQSRKVKKVFLYYAAKQARLEKFTFVASEKFAPYKILKDRQDMIQYFLNELHKQEASLKRMYSYIDSNPRSDIPNYVSRTKKLISGLLKNEIYLINSILVLYSYAYSAEKQIFKSISKQAT